MVMPRAALRRRIFGKADVLRWLVPVVRNLERSMGPGMIRAARLADILVTIRSGRAAEFTWRVGKLISHVGLCPHTHPLRAKLKFRAQKAQPCGCSSSVERKLPKL